ncbi:MULTISPECIES: DUF4421 domain-containing protein [Mangrovimonas]|uniref:DUF4421 domain-containing protein n=1 Tax=Mangrovimonas TaxID=1211036 RepID=UPI00141F759A|nr:MULTISPECIES: DUF4421 domain-containing protein [Mangrovimonas]MCF1420998.1 DUF4421 domain-containing protein [Mangrovimonas futianensis]NIK90799.1 DUF4421 domain-containing protein [Mangrovimonas sp. CR14]
MGLKKLALSLSLAILPIITFSQETEEEIVYKEESEYKVSYPNRITARAFYVNTSNSLILKDRFSDLFFNLEPNKQNRIGASVSFRGLSASYSFAPDFLAENEDNEHSRLFNFSLRNFFGKHFMQTFDIFNEKGFYLKLNNDDAISVYLPNTNNFKIGGATSYIWNENFSFRAITSQDEKQLKSTGSFIPRIVYYYTKFNLEGESGTDGSYIDSSYYSFDIAFAPSYYYNFVPTKNLLLSAGASAGIGLNRSKSEGEDPLVTLLTELNFRGSATYDIDNLYLGAHYSYLILNHAADRTSRIKDNIPYFQIFVGYRFKAPKSLVQFADKMQGKLNEEIEKIKP